MTSIGEIRLKEHEGLRLKVYTDTVGKLTIGYGRNLDDVGISHDEAELMFEHDIERATAECRYNFPWFDYLDAVRQDAIVNLTFNMGIGGIKTFKRMITALQEKNYMQAAWELSNSKWKQQVGKERHDAITNAIEYGEWK